MVYPESPFINDLLLSITTTDNNDAVSEINQTDLQDILSWLCTAPKVTSFRINTLKTNAKVVKELAESALIKVERIQDKWESKISIKMHPILSDVIFVDSYSNDILKLRKHRKEVIVDASCGAAVLRGANVFGPGVMGMLKGTRTEDIVSVYADISKKCTRGFPQVFDDPTKVFVGNGIVRLGRHELFRDGYTPKGVAVVITDSLSGCPSISERDFPVGSVLLQNLPSILCGHVLNPKPGDLVLDMCAAPGNKTSHLAALMKNDGILIALDKTQTKLKRLQDRCKDFNLKCVYPFQFDSTKSFDPEKNVLSDPDDLKLNGPPFGAETFDKILLDAPCSGLGIRPQLLNTSTHQVVRSYAPLQRKLFANAVPLLKVGGRLAYSTCTITLAENEGIVSWALRAFPCLELTFTEPYLGGPGWSGTNLHPKHLKFVQRFGPKSSTDSIGFFIALFVKHRSL